MIPELPNSHIESQAAWNNESLSADRSWIYSLDSAQTSAINDLLPQLMSRDLRHAEIGLDYASLPAIDKLIEQMLDQVENGRGVVLLKGIPVSGKSISEIELMYTAIAARLGRSIVQDTRGTLIDRVENRGASYDDIAVRGYTTNAKLTPHCDSGDLVALLCVRQAKSGGKNTIASSMAIYNELLTYHPEMLAPLARGFHYNIRGNGPPGQYRDFTAHRVPVYSYHEGKLSCRFNAKAILTSEQLPGVHPLSSQEKAAVNKVAELSVRPDLSVDVLLEPGDLLLLCNHSVFHTRDAFEDWEDTERRRLLLRKWINIHNGRELTWQFADHYNTGPREGPCVKA
jgi:hypothetical protein